MNKLKTIIRSEEELDKFIQNHLKTDGFLAYLYAECDCQLINTVRSEFDIVYYSKFLESTLILSSYLLRFYNIDTIRIIHKFFFSINGLRISDYIDVPDNE